MGDFNAHTGSLSGNAPHIHADILSNFQYDPPPIHQPQRHSMDTRTPDNYGKKLSQLCSNRNLTILNGCTPGDSQGQFTYEKGNIHSVIDYGATSPSLTPLVRNFQIGQHNCILSDHSILLIELNLHHTPHSSLADSSTPSPLLRFDWSPEAQERLRIKFQEPTFHLQLQILEARLTGPNCSVDSIVSDFSHLLLSETKNVVKFHKKGPPP